MKKVLLSSLVALMAITTANAAGVSGIASTNYVDDAIGKIEIPEVVDVVADGNMNAVTSNAVSDALGAKADKSDIVIKTHTSGSEDTISVTDENNTVTVTANVDTAPTADSAKLITSGAVKTALDTKADKETTLSGYGITDAYTRTETDGLLGNKADKSDIVIKTHASGNEDTISVTDENNTVTVTANVDTAPTANSAKLITSGAVKTALDNKADKSDIVIKTHTSGSADTITVTDENNTVTVTANVDTAPTANSAKLITSGAVKTALDSKADKETTLSGYGITDAYTKTETDGYLNSKVDTTKVYNGTVLGAPDNEMTQALIPSVATMAKDISGVNNSLYELFVGVEKDAVRVDKDKNMIVENNTDYGDCAVGDTCTLVAVRTASGMQSVWKKIFPAAQ